MSVESPAFSNLFGRMHAKLMLLTFDKFVRVVISSANLMPFDYDTIENGVFIQDFPETDALADMLSPFAKDLCTFVKKLTNYQPIQWEKYDWSRASVEIIASVPGSYFLSSECFLGVERLKKCISPLLESLHQVEIQVRYC